MRPTADGRLGFAHPLCRDSGALTMRPDLAVRIGMLALPASAWLAWAFTLQRGPMRLPGDAGFAAWVQADAFSAWTSAALNATVWLGFGIIALHAWSDGMPARMRFYGAATALAGTMVWLPILGVMDMGWTVAPEHAGAMVQELTFGVWSAFAATASVVGFVLLGIGLWRTGRCWAGAILAVSAIPAYLPFRFALEVGGGLGMAVAFTMLAWHAWRPAGAAPPPPPAPA